MLMSWKSPQLRKQQHLLLEQKQQLLQASTLPSCSTWKARRQVEGLSTNISGHQQLQLSAAFVHTSASSTAVVQQLYSMLHSNVLHLCCKSFDLPVCTTNTCSTTHVQRLGCYGSAHSNS
jgi:hypothetical protein